MGHRERCSGKLPGFSFCLIDPRLGLKKQTTRSTNEHSENSSCKSLLSLLRGPEKGQSPKTENFSSAKHHRQKGGPTQSHQQRPVGGLDSTPPRTEMSHLPYSCQGGVRGGRTESGPLPLHRVMSPQPIPFNVSGGHMGNSNEALLPTPPRVVLAEAQWGAGTIITAQQ